MMTIARDQHSKSDAVTIAAIEAAVTVLVIARGFGRPLPGHGPPAKERGPEPLASKCVL
jgi:hypothetical protein